MIPIAKPKYCIDIRRNIIVLTSSDLVERLQAAYGGVSVYRVAKELGYGNGRVLNWLHGRAAPSQVEAIRIAEILHLNPGYVLACMEAQRQSDPNIAEAWGALALRVA